MAEQIGQLFQVAAAREGIHRKSAELSTAAFRNPAGSQLEMLL